MEQEMKFSPPITAQVGDYLLRYTIAKDGSVSWYSVQVKRATEEKLWVDWDETIPIERTTSNYLTVISQGVLDSYRHYLLELKLKNLFLFHDDMSIDLQEDLQELCRAPEDLLKMIIRVCEALLEKKTKALLELYK